MRHEPDELRALSEDLLYEAQMLFGTADRLRRHVHEIEPLPVDLLDSCLESFAIHARLLDQFFWKDPKPGFPDDAFAADYFPAGEWAKTRTNVQRSKLDGISKRTGHEIAHLSYKRIHIAAEAREWEFDVIAGVIGYAFRLFLADVSSDLLTDGFESQLRQTWPTYLNFPYVGGFPPDQPAITVASEAVARALPASGVRRTLAALDVPALANWRAAL